jgi:phosphoglycolate phosphatase
MPYKAILFDLDGTLIDSLDDIGGAMNRTLERKGFPVLSRESYRKNLGEGATMLATMALPEESRDEKTIADCLQAFIEDYHENWKVKTKIYDGIRELLDRLSSQGLKMGVLSNKPHLLTQKCVSEFLPEWNFEVVLGQREGVQRKPDPTGAFEAAARLNVSPNEFLYLGDTGIDMKTAVAASMFPVGALWGFRHQEELRRDGARALISHPLDMMGLLEFQDKKP